MDGGFIAMNEVIWVIGDAWLGEVVARHTPLSIVGQPEAIDGKPALIIDPRLGPPRTKRLQLESLAEAYPGSLVLTASTAVLLARQEQWIGGRLHLSGFDPWLMRIDAKRMTVVHESVPDPHFFQYFRDWEWDQIEDSIGGVFARVIAPLVNEAMAYHAFGLADAEIDRAIRRGLNHPRGPLEWAKIFGLSDIGLMLEAMREAFGDGYLPHPEIRRDMAREGVDWNA